MEDSGFNGAVPKNLLSVITSLMTVVNFSSKESLAKKKEFASTR